MSAATVEYLLTNATVATMKKSAASEDNDCGLIKNAAVGIGDNKIVWLGKATEAPPAERIEDCRGYLLTPALIDCHTHLVYGGNRADEFAQRLAGISYAEIARRGGGIAATVKATRAASEEELLQTALMRLNSMLAQGVTTVEIKSGYGLDVKNELKMLRVARQLERERAVRIKTTLLAAHTVPEEFTGRSDDYISFICEEILPAAHAEGLVDAVDAFAEHIAFSPPQIERLFIKAQELNLPLKLHAEQLSNMGGAVMAAQMGALSVDHLEYLPADDADMLARYNTVAVLLPGAFYFLRETQKPPLAALRKAGVTLAVASDANPGSSPLYSLPLALNMACVLFGLKIEEALAAATAGAAQALGLQNVLGSIEPGKIADLALWKVARPADLIYPIGDNLLLKRIFGGKAE